MIREATRADVDAIVAMGQRFLSESGYKHHLTENPAQMRTIAERLIAMPEGALFVSTDADVITGMFGLFVYQHPISADTCATELFWWVEPEKRGHGIRLLKTAEQWARTMGARVLQMIAPTPQVERVYDALGYTRVEVSYQRGL